MYLRISLGQFYNYNNLKCHWDAHKNTSMRSASLQPYFQLFIVAIIVESQGVGCLGVCDYDIGGVFYDTNLWIE